MLELDTLTDDEQSGFLGESMVESQDIMVSLLLCAH
jgi:hypothetical protein